MIFHAIAIPFTCFLLLYQPDPIELIPVDAGVEDFGVLSDSLRVEQSSMRQDVAFEKLYKIAGRDDVYVRKSGGLSAVFRSSAYLRTSGGDIPIVPAGTVYCIGEIPPELIQQLGVLQEPVETPESPTMKKAVMATQQSSIAAVTESIPHHSIEFLDNETYRRQRLASFVLEIVLLD